ncbi:MAG TPA: BLUF domain-containing protein [Cellvibrionaceae bacterium]
MSSLMQLVYISRANFKPSPAAAGVEPVVARILQQSRTNNPRLSIGGVLYYGDGCFFQCLEGEQQVVLKLVDKLKGDTRHKDFRIVHQAPVTERQFSDWSMKYIPVSDAVKSLLESRGHKRFDPYQFDSDTHNQLLRLFRSLGKSSQEQPGAPSAAATKMPVDALLVSAAAVLVLGMLGFWLWF